MSMTLGHELGSDTAVILGTALGSMTETMSFVESMIKDCETNPKPRAFAASVHNAIASHVALVLGARGACQTFVHGSTSWAQSLFAATRVVAEGNAGPVIAGALDEWSEYIPSRSTGEGEAPMTSHDEGGGLLLLAPSASARESCPTLRGVHLARARDPMTWLHGTLAGNEVDMLLFGDTRIEPGASLGRSECTARSYESLVGAHPSAGAAALVLAAEILRGKYDVSLLDLPKSIKSIGIATISHLGDVAFAAIDGPR